MFALQVVLFVIYLLNYLIAIVSDSYSHVTENQAEAILLGRLDLNGEHLKSLWSKPDKDIEMIMMATCINTNDSSAWEGVAKSIKRKIGETNRIIEQRFAHLTRMIRNISGQ